MAENPKPTFKLVLDRPATPDASDPTIGDTIHDTTAHPWEESVYPLVEDAKDVARRKEETVAAVIENRLRDNVVWHPKVTNSRFWPSKLFDHLFREKDVRYLMDELLQPDKSTAKKEDSPEHLTGVICGRGSDQPVYRRLLALLLLAQKPQRILKCISERLSDDQLPLGPNSDILKKLKLRPTEVDLLCLYQGWLSVPLFKAPEGSRLGDVRVYHVDLTDAHIQPWDYLDQEPQQTAAQDYALQVPVAESHTHSISSGSDLGGGYGEVHRIIIHP